MIKSFRHRGLKELFETGRTTKIRPDLQQRARLRLDALEAATDLKHLNQPGFDFHPLKGMKPVRYSLHVNGPWCITFGWSAPMAKAVDLEQYH